MKRSFLLISIFLLMFIGANKGFTDNRPFIFGLYDEYSLYIYDETRTIPKTGKIVFAIGVNVPKDTEVEYAFTLLTPKKLSGIKVWNYGEWKRLTQGGLAHTNTTRRGDTHKLRNKIYSITGSYHTQKDYGKFIYGVFNGGSFPTGNYKLLVKVRYNIGEKSAVAKKTFSFKIVPPR